MKTRYSVYEAKTHLSEILRGVREQRVIIITDRGRDVAQVGPAPAKQGFAARVEALKRSGVIVHPRGADPSKIRAVAHRPGALKMFLETRHRY